MCFGRVPARPTVRLAVAIVAVVLTHAASAFYLPVASAMEVDVRMAKTASSDTFNLQLQTPSGRTVPVSIAPVRRAGSTVGSTARIGGDRRLHCRPLQSDDFSAVSANFCSYYFKHDNASMQQCNDDVVARAFGALRAAVGTLKNLAVLFWGFEPAHRRL